MPARVFVYCKRSVGDVTAQMLADEIGQADLMTLAEVLDLPEGETAAVREMRKHFRIEPAGGTVKKLDIHWHESQPPIQIECGPPLDGEIQETLDESLPKSDLPGAARVRAHLAATTELVHFRLGVPGSMHLAATITEVVAFYLAERGDGIIWFYHRDFASPDDRTATLWQTSKD